VTAQSTWKKSVASIVAACACRNCRHVVSVRRIADLDHFRVQRRDRVGGVIHEYRLVA
jgi:hypothetical protein